MIGNQNSLSSWASWYMSVISTPGRMKKEEPEFGGQPGLHSDTTSLNNHYKASKTSMAKDGLGLSAQLQPLGTRYPTGGRGWPHPSVWAPGLWGLASPGHSCWQSKQPLGYCKVFLVLLGISFISREATFRVFIDTSFFCKVHTLVLCVFLIKQWVPAPPAQTFIKINSTHRKVKCHYKIVTLLANDYYLESFQTFFLELLA